MREGCKAVFCTDQLVQLEKVEKVSDVTVFIEVRKPTFLYQS